MGGWGGDRSFGLVLRHLGIYNCNGSIDRGFDVSVLIPLCLELLIVGLGVIHVKVGELEYHLLAVGERFVQRLLLFLEGNEHGRLDPYCVADRSRCGADDGEGGVQDSPPLGDLDLYPALVGVRVAVKLPLDDDYMVVHRHLEVDLCCRVLFSLTSVVVVNRSGSLK